MLLIAPLFLILFWDPIWFIVIVVAFILELRQLTAGDGFIFSFVLIVFVGLMSALTMVELENNQQASGFHGPGDAFVWAFGGLAAHRHWDGLHPHHGGREVPGCGRQRLRHPGCEYVHRQACRLDSR
ncbi:MAG: hypothetical protein V9E98_12625 [Candidatus Nanopelagicales bacterium]